MKLVVAKWGVYKNRSDLLEHLNTFNMLNTQLSIYWVTLEEEYKLILSLTSLLTSFDHLVTMLMYGNETLEFEEMTSALLSHSKMKKDDDEDDDSQPDGLVVDLESNRGRSRLRGSNSNKKRSWSRLHAKKDVDFLYYHMKWHNKNQCKELKQHLGGEE